MDRNTLRVLIPRTKWGWGFVILYAFILVGTTVSLLLDLSGLIVVGFLVGPLLPAWFLFEHLRSELIKEIEQSESNEEDPRKEPT